MMQHYEEEQREEEEGIEEETETEKIQEQAIADILKGVDYENIDSSQGIRLNQMLRKYISRKTRLEEREKQVSVLQDKYFTPLILLTHSRRRYTLLMLL